MVVEDEGRMVQKAECPTNSEKQGVAKFCQDDIILSQHEQPCARVMRNTRSAKRCNELIFQPNPSVCMKKSSLAENKHSLCRMAWRQGFFCPGSKARKRNGKGATTHGWQGGYEDVLTRRDGMNQGSAMWRVLRGGLASVVLFCASPAFAANDAEVAEHLIDLVKIGRGVLSEQMANINDPSKENKGFTGDFMATQVVDRFKKHTKIDLRIPNVVPQANLYLALVEAEKEVVDEAQPIINKKGISFKGFIPAVFARRTGEHFYKKSGVRLKLTGSDYRNPNNKPDDFEAEVLRMFGDPRHPKGQSYVRNTMMEGRPVLRMMDPEYAGASCLNCHGAPKGERDVTGNKKEGWKEGELAGAISIVLPLK